MGERRLLLGNEAIAEAAMEAAVNSKSVKVPGSTSEVIQTQNETHRLHKRMGEQDRTLRSG